MIYTLEYLEKEAEGIASSWNGEDEFFYYEDTKYHEHDVAIAEALLKNLQEIKAQAAALKL